MKTKLLFIILALSSALSSLCQTPQGINYQAIARGSDGKEITETTLQVRLSILSDSTGYYSNGLGIAVWEEEQTVTTNSFGLFSMVLGKDGAARIRGSADHFSDINWKTQSLFIGTKIKYLGEWRIMGSARLWSVPYSMLSGDISGPVKKLSVTADTASVMDEPLFEVKNRTGQTVLAVYNEGVRIYVDDGVAKSGKKGGFAIGSFGTAKTNSQPLLVVNPDSIRAYVYDDTLAKGGLKGGFAIGGFSGAKGITNEYLLVGPDSIRAYISSSTGKAGRKGGFAIGGFDQAKTLKGEEYMRITRDSSMINVSESSKGTKGGFAIGSFNPGKGGPVTSFTSLTPENYFIGHRSGKKITSGLYNSFLGFETGIENTTGADNALFGFQAGFMNISGSGNLFLGYQTGYTNKIGNYNSFMGYKAGNMNSTGDMNSFMGSYSGLNNTSGSYNSFLGYNSGYSNIDGSANNFVGTNSGYSNTSGSNNIFIGTESGFLNEKGNYNIFIGYQTGYSNSSGNFNMILGYQAGFSNDTSYNSFIGFKSGYSNQTGRFNTFMGYRAGYSNISGDYNTYIGHQAGAQNTGIHNVYVGPTAGSIGTSGSYNVFIGMGSGSLATGNDNTFIGTGSGYHNKGEFNSFFGAGAGLKNNDGVLNTFLGSNAGYNNVDASENVFVGSYAGSANNSGVQNVFIGNNAGMNNISGSKNIYIGYHAGESQHAASSEKLIIDNSNAATPLIYGDFSTDQLKINGTLETTGIASLNKTFVNDSYLEINGGAAGDRFSLIDFHSDDFYSDFSFRILRNTGQNAASQIIHRGTGTFALINNEAAPMAFYTNNTERMTIIANGNVGIGTNAPGYKLSVNGSAWCTSGSWTVSDIKLKKNITLMEESLSRILALNPVRYDWRTTEFPQLDFDSNRQIGLIAQEVEKMFPELVNTGSDGFKSVSYEKLSVLILQGIKEQQKIIDNQEEQIQVVRNENVQLRNELQTLKDEVTQLHEIMLEIK